MNKESKPIDWDNLDDYIERPTTRGGYTPEDLRRYAIWRKRREFRDMEIVDSDITTKDLPREEHEEYREPLAITFKKVATIELSTGGDADGFEIEFDDSEVTGGIYYWADWGVYERVNLSMDEAEKVAEFYGVYPE